MSEVQPDEEAGNRFFDALFGIRVRRLQSLFGAHWQRWFRVLDVGVTPVQGGVLLLVRSHPAISQNALARLMKIEPPTLMQALAPLFAQQLVSRRRSATDGRIFELVLTDRGFDIAQRVEQQTPLHELDILRGLDGHERSQLLALLDKAILGAEAALAERELTPSRMPDEG